MQALTTTQMEPPARSKIPLAAQNHDQVFPTKTAIFTVAKASFRWLYGSRRKSMNWLLKIWPSEPSQKCAVLATNHQTF